MGLATKDANQAKKWFDKRRISGIVCKCSST